MSDFFESSGGRLEKSDQQISDEMMDILRLKRIAEQTQKMFDAQQNADTPVPIVLEESAMTVELSPRDVSEMYTLIRRLARGKVGPDFVELVMDANKFIWQHEPGRDWVPR